MLAGARPHTAWLEGAVERDRHGFILTGSDLPAAGGRTPRRFETSLPGVFAAGDVRHGSIKRLAAAVGEGSVAVRMIQERLAAPVAAAAG